MQRTLFLLVIGALAACASQEPITEAEARFAELAKERRQDERYPVLAPLPGEAAVVGEGIPGSRAGELRGAASEFDALRGRTGLSDDPLSANEIAAELQAMVARLQAQETTTRPEVDVEALSFPTPPPLN